MMFRKALIPILLALPFAGNAAVPDVEDGDIIFHTSRSAQSDAIQRATGSRYSHMGLVFHQEGQPYVLEAAATVRSTPLADWIARGEDRKFVVKRLRTAAAVLSPDALDRLRAEATPFVGRRYDAEFAWSDERIYCSELVWKAYDRALGMKIGSLDRIGDFNLSDPVVRAALRERYGDTIPLEEPVISPSAMFDSPLLITVAEDQL